MTILLNNINSFLQNDVLTLLLAIIWFFSYSLILSNILNRKQGEMYLLSFVFSSFLLFIGGILNNISLLYYLGWIFLFSYLIYLIVTKKYKYIIRHIDWCSSLLLFAIITILFILYQNKSLTAADEFSTWAPMVREMFNINKFYCVFESSLSAHKDYPPFFGLVELIFCLFKKGYRECYLYIALLSFYFSIAIALSSNKDKIIEKIFIIILFFLLGFSAHEYAGYMFEIVSIYITIYIDYVLAIFAAYVIYYAIAKDNNTLIDKIIRISLLNALMISKQSTIIFYILYIVILYYKKKLDIVSVLFPFFLFSIWKIIVNYYQIIGQFAFDNVLFRDESIYIMINYIKSLFTRPIFTKPLSCSFVSASVIIIVILLCIRVKTEKKYYLIYIIGMFLYLLTLMLLYGFVFSVEEAKALASFERYMYSYVLFGMGLLVFIIYDYSNTLLYTSLVLSLILITDFNNSNIYRVTEYKDILVIKQWGDPITFCNGNDNGYVLNLKIRDYITDNTDYDDLTKEISNYHYLYVYLYDDNFYNYWVNYTGDYGLENDSVFYIANNSGDISYANENFTKPYYAIKYYLKEQKK